MNTLSIKGTSKTPSITFDASKGIIEIKGCSTPENAIEFYSALTSHIEKYVKKPQPKTHISICLEYFNTSSSKCILNILERLEAVHKINQGVTVSWYYHEEDEDMQEVGRDYENITRMPFKMIKI